MFMLDRFVPNAIDVLKAGVVPDPAMMIAEFRNDHRLSSRRFVAQLLPKNAVGAEIGVFTGLFSTVLLDIAKPKRAYFVDPWMREFGEFYPDWGLYTDKGKLKTAVAQQAAEKRVASHRGTAETSVHVDYSVPFFGTLPDESLDWVYLDSSHFYEPTMAELEALTRKLKPGGIIAGDDWHDDPTNRHYGVAKAVNEMVALGQYRMIGAFDHLQWAIMRS